MRTCSVTGVGLYELTKTDWKFCKRYSSHEFRIQGAIFLRYTMSISNRLAVYATPFMLEIQ